MAGINRPSSSSNPPQGSQIMPRKLRESMEKEEEEIKEIEARLKLKETDKRPENYRIPITPFYIKSSSSSPSEMP